MNKISFRTVATCIGLLLLGACANVGVTQLRAEPAPAREDNCKLDVFTSPQEVGQPFEAVCLIDSHAGHNVANAIAETRRYACRCGADALLLEQAGTEPGNSTFFAPSAGWGLMSSSRRGSAVLKAIRFKH